MTFLALRMLVGDRVKYAGLLFGITFTAFLVTFAGAYFGGMMTRSFALLSETPADVWVMDTSVSSVDQTISLPDWALDRVRSVPGVVSAVPLAVASTEARYQDGTFQTVQLIGLDDSSLAGMPKLPAGLQARPLRGPDACIIDSGGTDGKLDLLRMGRPLARGDTLKVNDNRLLVLGRSEALPRYPPRPLVYTTISTLRRILPVEREQLTFILVHGASGADLEALAGRIQTQTGLRARTTAHFKEDTVRWMVDNSEDVGDVINMLFIAMLVGTAVAGVMMFMFTHESLKYYAVLKAMGATAWQMAGAALAQAGVAALVGAGMGLGLCTIAGRIFDSYDFPYRLLWFAPVLGAAAVLVIALIASAVSLWPMLRMQPAAYLSGRQ